MELEVYIKQVMSILNHHSSIFVNLNERFDVHMEIGYHAHRIFHYTEERKTEENEKN